MFRNRKLRRQIIILGLLILLYFLQRTNENPGTGFGGGNLPVGQGSTNSVQTEYGTSAEPLYSYSDPESDLVLQYYGCNIPWQLDETYIVLNDNVPFFNESDYSVDPFETYSELDSLGRCGTAYANICRDLMPTEKRGDISRVKPTGWVQKKYESVEGGSLYNRCHLIGYQLAGENDNWLNLITGTRWLNVKGMLPFENMVADFVKETGEHVLYRVTPIFAGDELVARGVVMEGYSVESSGADIEFCVFVYNTQLGIEIDYKTGESRVR